MLDGDVLAPQNPSCQGAVVDANRPTDERRELKLSRAVTVVTNDDAAFGPVARWADVDDHHLEPITGVMQTLRKSSLFS